MKHINEVDVSAWGRPGNGQEFQIEELEVSLDINHHVRYRRFYMRFCDGDVWFRFRLPSQFNAHGASTIQTLVFTSRRGSDRPIFLINHRQEWRAKDTRSSQELRHEEPVDVPNQECCDINRMLQPLPPGPSRTDNKALLANSENKTPKLPSIVRAIFRLGDSLWLGERYTNRIACRDKDAEDVRQSNSGSYVNRTFERLEGADGNIYIWDIFPVSDELFEQLRISQQGNNSISRESMSMSVPSDPITNRSGPEPTLPSNRSTSDVVLATSAPSISNEVPSVVAKARASIKRIITTKKKSPEVCDCGDPDHQPAGRKRKQNGNLVEPSSSPRQRGKRNDKGIAASTREEKPLAHEMVAGVCGQCQHLKKAPRGKKIAWRNHLKTWMIVDTRAHDEEPPTEEIIEEQELPDDGNASSSTYATNDNGKNRSPGHDVNTINTSSSSSLEPCETNNQPTADPSRERSVVPSPITGTRNPVNEDRAPTELQMTEVSSNAMTASLQEDTVARPSDDQGLHTACAQATSAGVPSTVHARSNQRSQRKPPGVVLDLTGDDDDVTVKHEVKREPKVKAEEQRLGIPQAITNVDGLENKSKAALLEELQDVEMGEARTRLEEQKLLLRQKRIFLERQLKKKKHESGTQGKPIKIEEV